LNTVIIEDSVGIDVIFVIGFAKLDILRDFNLEYGSLVDIVVVILLCIGLLVVMATPLFLLCCWTIYSVDYVKKYRSKFSVQKWFTGRSALRMKDIASLEWIRYRSTYARMVGFGFSILAYGTASTVYLIKNFKRIENGMVEYLSFPFKVVKNLDHVQSMDSMEPNDLVLFPYQEAWNEMIFIVIISAIFFLAGYIFAAFLVDYRLRKLKKSIPQTTKFEPKKEMFVIKRERSID
jgi:hypothetical protein